MILLAIVLLTIGVVAEAQRVRVQLSFPVTVRVQAPGAAPFRGAIWIGPEWRWNRGHYVVVPGFWAKPRRHRAYRVPGHWQYSRRGYYWRPGYWR